MARDRQGCFLSWRWALACSESFHATVAVFVVYKTRDIERKVGPLGVVTAAGFVVALAGLVVAAGFGLIQLVTQFGCARPGKNVAAKYTGVWDREIDHG
jgi:hypothetical protein